MRYYYETSNERVGHYGSKLCYKIYDRQANKLIAKFYDLDDCNDYLDIKNKAPA